jgi:hypothetical protein
VILESIDVHNVSQAIRDAVAPVFLLTGIGSILNVLIGRLARAIDRARFINQMGLQAPENFLVELDIVISRVRWLRRSIALATFAALCVCVSIVSLFVSVESGINMPHVVMWSFIFSMCAVIFSLGCFLVEIFLTSREVIVESKHK